MTVAISPDVGQQLRAIDEIDLEPIVFKLVHPEPGEEGLTVTEADRRVALYRQFLKLCVMYPQKSIVPSKEIDAVWHTHILDTSKYRVDCQHVFGRMLEHFPYLGLRGAEDVERWQKAFAETHLLFMEHFDVSIGQDAIGAECQQDDGGALCLGEGSCQTHDASSLDRERPRLVRA